MRVGRRTLAALAAVALLAVVLLYVTARGVGSGGGGGDGSSRGSSGGGRADVVDAVMCQQQLRQLRQDVRKLRDRVAELQHTQAAPPPAQSGGDGDDMGGDEMAPPAPPKPQRPLDVKVPSAYVPPELPLGDRFYCPEVPAPGRPVCYDTYRGNAPLGECTTFATAYIKFSSKHSAGEYSSWMSNFAQLDMNIMYYGNQESIDMFMSVRPAALRAKTVTVLADFPDFYVHRWNAEWDGWQHAKDYETSIHNWRLYEIWNEKSMFVEHAIEHNVFNCSNFYWLDTGYVRHGRGLELTRAVQPFPSVEFTARHPRIQLLAVENINDAMARSVRTDFPSNVFFENRIAVVGGGGFGGRADYVEQWVPLFYSTMRSMMQREFFAGKDQSIMANVAIRYPHLAELWEVKQNHCHDMWFCMLDILSGVFVPHYNIVDT